MSSQDTGPKRRTMVYLSEETHKRLRLHRAQSDEAMTDYIERAVVEAFDRDECEKEEGAMSETNGLFDGANGAVPESGVGALKFPPVGSKWVPRLPGTGTRVPLAVATILEHGDKSDRPAVRISREGSTRRTTYRLDTFWKEFVPFDGTGPTAPIISRACEHGGAPENDIALPLSMVERLTSMALHREARALRELGFKVSVSILDVLEDLILKAESE